MQEDKILFTAGQFARLHNINKRTLHYYDEIGLFSPLHKGENGYRYYTYMQSTKLEIILALRELDMSIEEISQYMSNRCGNAFHRLISTKTAEIDAKIQHLKEIRQLLKNKEKLMELSEQTDLNDISLVECQKEYLLLSRKITDACVEEYLAALVEHTQQLPDHRQFNKSYGSMVSVENILSEDFDKDVCFFTRVGNANACSDLFIKPKGIYLRAFCKGDWTKIPSAYRRIVEYADKNNLTLTGYSYEEGINEMAISSMEEYVTQIMILCK